ncbi:MAG: hypothetical protein MUE73_13920 [Planctomycetes bacterium]|nr:hypothetical protein [Planctomycetota bacterium]
MRLLALLLLALLASGCIAPLGTGPRSLTGLVFTLHTIPLTEDLDDDAVVVVHRNSDTRQIREPISGAGLSATWHTNALGDIAREHGLTHLDYADIETLSVLGIWTQETVHLFGR